MGRVIEEPIEEEVPTTVPPLPVEPDVTFMEDVPAGDEEKRGTEAAHPSASFTPYSQIEEVAKLMAVPVEYREPLPALEWIEDEPSPKERVAEVTQSVRDSFTTKKTRNRPPQKTKGLSKGTVRGLVSKVKAARNQYEETVAFMEAQRERTAIAYLDAYDSGLSMQDIANAVGLKKATVAGLITNARTAREKGRL